MEKVIRTYNTVEKAMDRNRKMAFIAIMVCGFICLILGGLVYNVSQRKFMAVDKDGDIVSLTLTSESDLLGIEADNHIRLFYSRFFNYNKSNYRERVEMALHLAGNSGKELYETIKNKGWYDKVVNNDLILSTNISEIKLGYVNGDLRFEATAILKVERGDISDYRQLDLKGRINKAPGGRITKLNPHGLRIEDLVITNEKKYVQQEKIKVQF